MRHAKKAAAKHTAPISEGFVYQDGGFVATATAQSSEPLASALAAAVAARAAKRPPAHRRIGHADCGGLTFLADFDSGNLGHVEERSGEAVWCIDVELTADNSFILWTRADCEGTRHQARSRTWFYFAVQGASPGCTLHFEVRGMNPQMKLFQHDMRPVVRSLPSKPEWQRVAEPTQAIMPDGVGSNFAIRFRHRVDTSRSDTLFFAFTFPSSYAECAAKLAWADALFGRPVASLSPPPLPLQCAQAAGRAWRIAIEPLETCLRSNPAADVQRPSPGMEQLLDAARVAALEASLKTTAAESRADGHGYGRFDGLGNGGGGDDESKTSSPVSNARRLWVRAGASARVHAELAVAAARQAASLLPGLRPEGVYYHRELLTRSLEGRRIDLITISGTNQMERSTEPRLPLPLLPEGAERPRSFHGKKVVLISARVHPGETPASHVLDGLLAFLLRGNDPRAAALRQRFVFKLIPMLNPDGASAATHSQCGGPPGTRLAPHIHPATRASPRTLASCSSDGRGSPSHPPGDPSSDACACMHPSTDADRHPIHLETHRLMHVHACTPQVSTMAITGPTHGEPTSTAATTPQAP